jgi:uncharacterized Zn-binding protein involved in type VI secretion
MPGPLFHVGAVATCPHAGGQVTTISSNTRVLVSGMPVATIADQYLIAGCPLSANSPPTPCVTVQWLVPAARVLVNGQPAILQTSVGLALSAQQVPAGPPVVVTTQPRVIGT